MRTNSGSTANQLSPSGTPIAPLDVARVKDRPIVIYARASDPIDLQRQLKELTRLLKKPLTGVTVLTDMAASTQPRPGYEQLEALIEAGRVEAVFVTDPTRLHRDPKALGELLRQAALTACPIVTFD